MKQGILLIARNLWLTALTRGMNTDPFRSMDIQLREWCVTEIIEDDSITPETFTTKLKAFAAKFKERYPVESEDGGVLIALQDIVIMAIVIEPNRAMAKEAIRA